MHLSREADAFDVFRTSFELLNELGQGVDRLFDPGRRILFAVAFSFLDEGIGATRFPAELPVLVDEDGFDRTRP